MHRAYVQGVAMHGALECRVVMHGISLHHVAVDYGSSGEVLCAGVTAVPSENAAEGKHQHVSIQDVGVQVGEAAFARHGVPMGGGLYCMGIPHFASGSHEPQLDLLGQHLWTCATSRPTALTCSGALASDYLGKNGY